MLRICGSLILLLSLIVHISATLLATGVIFPLYTYPDDACSLWNPFIQSIKSSPSLPFIVVVNPNSGPGGPPGSQPDLNYQKCLPQLIAANSTDGNLKLLGYVDASKNSTTVSNDVLTYAQWSSSYRPQGIFFDDISDENVSADVLDGYKYHVNDARDKFSNGMVILNPGATPDINDYYTFADLVNVAETSYKSFSTSQLHIDASLAPAGKQSVMLADVPTTSTPSDLLSDLVKLGLQSIYMSNYNTSVAFERMPSNWSSFVTELTGIQLASNPNTTTANDTKPGNGAQGHSSIVIAPIFACVVLFSLF